MKPASSPITSKNHLCPSCGNTFKGKFCQVCGEKIFHPSDLGMKKFTLQTIDIFTHFDSKFLHSLKLLFTAPGFLPRMYVTGSRVSYAKPMQLFLLANIIFYFITHLLGVSDYSPHIGDHQYFGLAGYALFKWATGFDNIVAGAIDRMAEVKMAKLGLSQSQFMDNFFENSWIYSKTFIILLIPLTAIVLWAFYFKRFKYFGAALIFAVYFVAFQLLTFSIFSLFIYKFGIDLLIPVEWLFFNTPLKYITNLVLSPGFEFTTIILWFPYLYFALQRFPKGSPWLTFITAFICSKIFFFVTFSVYKKILIVLTLLLMHKVR